MFDIQERFKRIFSGKGRRWRLPIVFFSLMQMGQARAQSAVAGTYYGNFGLMGAELQVKSNGTYRYRFVNGESGTGNQYSGKWSLEGDSLILHHQFRRATRGLGRRRILTGWHKHSYKQTEVWILNGGRLCMREDSPMSQCISPSSHFTLVK
jgi:hypothetical protein